MLEQALTESDEKKIENFSKIQMKNSVFCLYERINSNGNCFWMELMKF